MITLGAIATSVIESGSFVYHVRMKSWLGGTLLTDVIPVVSASEETDAGLAVPERVSLTVPRESDGISWDPTGVDDHPLAANGQIVAVELGVDIGPDGIEWFQRGEFVIYSAEPQGDAVEVEMVGLLWKVEQATFVSPYQPSGNLSQVLRNLMEPNVTVTIDADLVDRAVPASTAWEDDRIGAVYEVVDNWPARLRMHQDGYAVIEPATQSMSPVRSLTDGVGGTVVEIIGQSTQDGAYNTFVSEGADANGAIVRGVAYDRQGPKRYDGPFNAFPVPFTHYSPLLTTQGAASAAAVTTMERKRLENALELKVTLVPDPRLQIGDVVNVTTERLGTRLCSIWSLSLPYTPDGGAMELTVREIR